MVLAEIFLGWAVELLLEQGKGAVVGALGEKDSRLVLRQALDEVRGRIADGTGRQQVVEALALHLGGRAAAWDVAGVAAPRTLRDGIETQIAPIPDGTFELQGQRVRGEEVLRGLGVNVSMLAEMVETGLIGAVRRLATEQGGVVERIRQLDVSTQNKLLEQIREEITRGGGTSRQMPSGTTLRRGMVDLIEDKTEAFVGRGYVFDAIAGFLESADCGYFLIEGDPGSGKTSILAEYVRRTGCVAHFNIRSQGIGSVEQFAAALTDQLVTRLGVTAPLDVPEPDRYGPIINQLLIEASDALPAGERLVIVVDALDEATGGESDANVLLLPRNPPKGIYFLLSARRDAYRLEVEAPLTPYDLNAHRSETMRDIRAYLSLATVTPQLGSWLAERGIAAERFVEIMEAKSEANFMYLRYVLPELTRGFFRSLDLAELPQGLRSYYATHWPLMGMTADPLPRIKLWVIYVLCEFARPVSAGLVAEVLRPREPSVDVLSVQDVFDDWLQFLHREVEPDGVRFGLYHTSFRDFLHRRDIVASAGLSLPGVNGVIADALWEIEFGDAE